MSSARQHAEWRRLVDVSGPFLSLPVLNDAFPHGLDAHDPEVSARLRQGYEEWQETPTLHRSWIRFVLTSVLGHPEEVLLEGQTLPPGLRVTVGEHRETLVPDIVIANPDGGAARVLVQIFPPGTDLEKPLAGSRWKESPAGKMAVLLRGAKVRLGLVTNGEFWTLVDAPSDATTGFATWRAELWLEEPLTLRAFRSLLGPQRLFGVPENDTLEGLLARSAEHQQEVTDQLGRQVRRAVEILVQSFDRSDRESGRTLLGGTSEREVYDAAVTFMMRLVFLFCAEERGLFPLDLPQYADNYAASTLRDQLREAAEQVGEEILAYRTDAWQRLLASSRAIHGGVEHEEMSLPPYGGHLFDPDRFPFLEGRAPGTKWRTTLARPLPISNRTVLHLLEALQLLGDTKTGEAQRVSFRALDIEQVGHVYEGLLDHTVKRAIEPMLSLKGKEAEEPEVALSRLEGAAAKGADALAAEVVELTGRSEKAIGKDLAQVLSAADEHALLVACENDRALAERLRPFGNLIRQDVTGLPVVILADSLYVTAGSDRRSTGTHYTPRSLTEPIVRYTLEPLVYVGPSEGKPEAEWTLKSAKYLLALKVCDMACGSGAFLVEACRYLSTRLVEAWAAAEQENPGKVLITPEGGMSDGRLSESIIPKEEEERLALARRLVADRCLYGVDINAMAVEMAKLSLWLTTLQRNTAFTFLDHSIRCGDSLLGVTDLKSVELLSLDSSTRTAPLFLAEACTKAVEAAAEARRRLEGFTVKDVRDVDLKAAILHEADGAVEIVRLLADLTVGMALSEDSTMDVAELQRRAEGLLAGGAGAERQEALEGMRSMARSMVDDGKPLGAQERKPFHWPLEFPEAVREGQGFDAFIGNPPFLGGLRLETTFGGNWREHLVRGVGNNVRGRRGTADLCCYFLLRGGQLLRAGGLLGMLTTNSISEGDTRLVGLDQLTRGGMTVVRARPSLKWPGSASLSVATVFLYRGQWHGVFVLDEAVVSGIASHLTEAASAALEPYRLSGSCGRSFIGATVLGTGFTLSPETAAGLIEADARNRDVLFPHLVGEDINSRMDQSPSRWIINFFDWPLSRAAEYPGCLEIVEREVRPQRQKLIGGTPEGTRRGQFWWRYAQDANGLFRAMARVQRVLVRSIVSKYHAVVFSESRVVPSNAVVVFTFDDFGHFAVIQSAIHEQWANKFASSLETRLRYTPTSCFETFFFPAAGEALHVSGERYYRFRQGVMATRQEGLTALYNRVHDRSETSEDISRLRALHIELDYSVAAAYPWAKLDLGHGFHETKQGIRFTISEPARREVLGRLLELNHQRYAEEVKQGLHDKGVKVAKRRNAVSANATLIDLDEEA